MKSIWLGFLGTVFGAILGSLVTVIAQTHYQQLIYGPKEAVIDVSFSSISALNIDAAIRDQVESYPIFISIDHRQGPSAKGITIRLKSGEKLSDFEVVDADDKSSAKLVSGNELIVEVPELRRGATVKYRVMSKGDPKFTQSVLVSEGLLSEDYFAKNDNDTVWYKSDGFLIFMAISLASIFLATILYVASKFLGDDITEPLKDNNVKLLFLLTLILSLLPILDSIAVLIPLLMIWQLLRRTSRLEKALCMSKEELL
ncbi:hypothetical protein BCU54_011270 [Vibrio lentus]|nr:hypothetical protein [Vibrio lentus]PMI01383.1 hypothetical protein BCU54_00300 [Vibrio lentus]